MLPTLVTGIIDWKCALLLTHLLSGTPVWVDFEYLMALKEHEKGHAVMFLAGGTTFAVKETPEEVGKKINALPDRCRTGARVVVPGEK